jgi:hypothetical protein
MITAPESSALQIDLSYGLADDSYSARVPSSTFTHMKKFTSLNRAQYHGINCVMTVQSTNSRTVPANRIVPASGNSRLDPSKLSPIIRLMMQEPG